MSYRNLGPVLLILGVLGISVGACEARTPAFGLSHRIYTKPYLNMPTRADGTMPRLLSQTGAFSDTGKLTPAKGLIPYDLVVPFWSDGAQKQRWIAIPRGSIQFSATSEWGFPAGTVFVKTFLMATDSNSPAVTRRLETRLLVRDDTGGVYGVSYRWRADNSDADLLDGSVSEPLTLRAANGSLRDQTWYYPSRQDCLTCHTAKAGGVLGVKTRQLNRSQTYANGIVDNQLRSWNHIGLFSPSISAGQLASLPTLAALDDESRTLEDRARSYLDANCAQCHRPGGTVAYFDARFDTPLEQQGLINGPVLIDQGVDRPRVVSPHDIWRSIAYMRVNTTGDIKMPPLARETVDTQGVALLGEWISSLPGRAVLSPPVISPAGGRFDKAVSVELRTQDPGVDVRYTLDGSVPAATDARYEGPISITSPTVLRARAFKDGFTRSITTQEVFIVNP